MLRHNSLLRIKSDKCSVCGIFSPIKAKRMCQNCYDLETKKRYFKKYSESDESDDGESVSILKREADDLFSRVVRLRAAEPETGLIACYICGDKHIYTSCDLMHYVGRRDSSLRYHSKNGRAGCKKCNQYLDGNLPAYADKLEQEEKGLSEWLYLEGKEVYSFTRDELKRMILDWSREITHLKKIKNLK